jgi:hypothetical protein
VTVGEPSVADMLAEVERELKARAFVYPRLIGSGKLSQAAATRQTARMQAVADHLRRETQKGNLL